MCRQFSIQVCVANLLGICLHYCVVFVYNFNVVTLNRLSGFMIGANLNGSDWLRKLVPTKVSALISPSAIGREKNKVGRGNPCSNNPPPDKEVAPRCIEVIPVLVIYLYNKIGHPSIE